MKLDFNETNILSQNLRVQSKDALIGRLTQLIENTEDMALRDAAYSLRDKIFDVPEERLKEVFAEIVNKKIYATQQYDL